jgi:hypothetical protein
MRFHGIYYDYPPPPHLLNTEFVMKIHDIYYDYTPLSSFLEVSYNLVL